MPIGARLSSARRLLLFILITLSAVMAIPGVEILPLAARGLRFMLETRVVKSQVPDGFRGGSYDVIGVSAGMWDRVDVRYCPAEGDPRCLLIISDSNDVFAESVQLLPMPGGLRVDLQGWPAASFFVSSQELDQLVDPIVVFDGQRETLGGDGQSISGWWELVDSVCFAVAALVTYLLAPKRPTPDASHCGKGVVF
jgi:hypothetical protein